MRYVTQMGAVYKISDKNWCKFLESTVKGNLYASNLDQCGGEMIAILEMDVTDLTKEQAQDELDKLEQERYHSC